MSCLAEIELLYTHIIHIAIPAWNPTRILQQQRYGRQWKATANIVRPNDATPKLIN